MTPLIFLVVAFATASAHANHVMTGKVTVDDDIENAQGVRHITTEAELLMPIVPWESLSKEQLTVAACYRNRIKLLGPIDPSDFAEGYVMTFPKDDYLSLGCPLPPITDELSKKDEVIFRKITGVKVFKGGVRIRTSFVSGAQVAPKVQIHVGELLSPALRTEDIDKGLMELDIASRVNDIGITAFERDGTFPLTTGVRLNWGIQATAGVCEFDFDRFPPRASWEQRVSFEATGSLSVGPTFEKEASGNIISVPIIGGGFKKKIFLIGKVRFGLFANVGYEVALSATTAAALSFSGTFETGQKIRVGIGKFNTNSLGTSSDGGTGEIDFKGPRADVTAGIEGFAGIRPAIEAEVSLPIVGEAKAEIGGTIGLQLDFNYKYPPFQAVRAGKKLGAVCDRCHFVQGALNLEGRRFSVEGKVPVLGSKEIVIKDSFLDLRLGTACAFAASCPVSVTPRTRPSRMLASPKRL